MDITDTLPEINHMPLQNYIPAPIQGPKNSYSKDPLYYKSKYLKNLLDPDYEARKRIKNNYKRTTIKEKKKKSKLKELLDLVT